MKKSLYGIVIGTSAGGIDALGFLLPNIPAGLNMAIFVVQHISSDSDSVFIDILNQKCGINVREACHNEEIRTDIIYFAPPDYHLLIEKNFTISLSSEAKVNFSRPSIDVLFETAAEAFTNRLTGILLTGANRDGSQGLRRIKELGGTTIVQSPADAAFSEMPASALRLFTPDKIMTLKQIAEFLSNLPMLKA